MSEISQAFIDAIKTLANHKPLVEACEPNVCWHEDIKENEVVRVLTAYSYFKKATENSKVTFTT